MQGFYVIIKFMKRLLITIVSLFAFSLSVSAAGGDLKSRFEYQAPEAIIITHPNINSRVTVSPRISLLGASDPNFPMYINGEEIQTTGNGFFTMYTELELGENELLFENGNNSYGMTILRNQPGPSESTELSYYHVEVYGSTEYDSISRFPNYNNDAVMRTPLAKGTTFRILAERGDCYMLEDGTYVFKNNVYQLDRRVPPVVVSGGEVKSQDGGVSVAFNVSDYPLYDIELVGGRVILSMYAGSDESDLRADGTYIKDASKALNNGVLTYEIELVDTPVGYFVDFSSGVMTVEFRSVPKSVSGATVLIDAGHGGIDPGALGPPGDFGAMEKDFNLYVAQRTRDYLEKQGINVVMVRDEDVYIPIMDRVEYFALKPDISVCIHANSMPLSSNFAGEQGPLMFYTLDLSERAADDMMKIIAERTENDYAAPRRQNFAMARYTGGPSMLFEMGFLCNPEDYERMLDTDYLDKMGDALGESILQYLNGTASGEPAENDILPPDVPVGENEYIYEPTVPADAAPRENPLNTQVLLIVGVFVVLGVGAALYLPNRRVF